MIVKCKAKTGKDLPKDCLRPRSGFGEDLIYDLIIDKYYVVYGMTVYAGYIWFYICDESFKYYPFWNPCPLFEIANNELSKYWVYGQRDDGLSIIAYPEWAENPYYYDALSDGDKEEVKIFRKYKALMDLEFPNPGVKEKATILDETWLMCPLCIDGWQSTSNDGMVICPKCNTQMHNPRYKQ